MFRLRPGHLPPGRRRPRRLPSGPPCDVVHLHRRQRRHDRFGVRARPAPCHHHLPPVPGSHPHPKPPPGCCFRGSLPEEHDANTQDQTRAADTRPATRPARIPRTVPRPAIATFSGAGPGSFKVRATPCAVGAAARTQICNEPLTSGTGAAHSLSTGSPNRLGVLPKRLGV